MESGLVMPGVRIRSIDGESYPGKLLNDRLIEHGNLRWIGDASL